MTDLIPRDAAAAVCDKHSYSNNPYVSGRMADTAAEIRAIPTIDPACDHCGVDPAAIREAALREAADVAINACLVPPDGGSPTEEERLVCEEAYHRILALIGEKK